MEPGQALPELGGVAELDKKMFQLAKDEIGTAIQVGRGYVVPQVIEITAAHPASFEEGRTKVAADVRNEKAQELANNKKKQVEELLKAGKDLAAAAKAVGGEIKTSEEMTRGGQISEFGPTADLDTEAFSIPVGKPGTPLTIGGKTLAWRLKERQEAKPEEMKSAMDTIRNEMLPQRREQYFGAYIQEARKRMEAENRIKINESAVSSIAQGVI
jgi:parvulin-like peptidyl-prolyl isomerase